MRTLSAIRRDVDVVVGDERPRTFSNYRLLICDLGPRLPSPQPLLAQLRPDAHAVLIVPRLDVAVVARHLQDERVNHLLSQPSDAEDLLSVVDKLSTGSIFGMERYLPFQANIHYQRLASYPGRCKAIEELEAHLQKRRVRSTLRRSAVQIAEELLMNAMYQAPMENGHRLFADVEPRARLRRKTPRPVSLRYVAADKRIHLSVRDRFGSFRRADLASYLQRCTTSQVQIEEKKLGAGLGLYLIASTASRIIINVLPGSVTEFITVVEPPSANSTIRLFSFTAQRPLSMSEGTGEITTPMLDDEPHGELAAGL
ncbi:MAG: hypothetical protein IT371_02535 [Deltaproteobacteria bacterium]|nr:hypothetical protein [Deltaproteobacteria bacterium]